VTLETLLVAWAAKYDVETVLERIVGRGAPVCDPLATRGKRVVVARDDAPPETPSFDLVVVHGDEDPSGDWRQWLSALAKRASKLLVVETKNPRPRSLIARITGASNGEPSWGSTAALAPVLWELGRVREHAFLDAPPGATRKEAARTATRHAFVIDVTPRTPQARRKLRLGVV
jgi:hypothetical protein